MSRLFWIVVLVSSVWPSAASAQIYMSRDANGHMILSDRPIDNPTKVFEVPGAPAYLTTNAPSSSSKAARFEPLVQEQAAKYSVHPDLVRAVIQVESAFNPSARSHVGAMGLMQLMPGTARDLGVADPYDPAQNIAGGTRYLRQLLDKYQGNVQLALAAYNAGPGAVDRYGKKIPPYRETRDYVGKVSSVAGRTPAVQHASTSPAKAVFYKTTDIVNGRPVTSYTSTRPASGVYETIER